MLTSASSACCKRASFGGRHCERASVDVRDGKRARRRARNGWIALVLVAMLVAQALGLMHRVLHARVSSEPRVEYTAREAAHRDRVSDERASHGSWLGALSFHGEATDCRLYDGVASQVFLCAAAVALPVVAPALSNVRLNDGDFIARWAALFDARGPPLSR